MIPTLSARLPHPASRLPSRVRSMCLAFTLVVLAVVVVTVATLVRGPRAADGGQDGQSSTTYASADGLASQPDSYGRYLRSHGLGW